MLPKMCSVLALVLLCTAVRSTSTQEYRTINALRKNILKDYDKYARPVQHLNNVTVVTVNFVPRYLLDLNEEKQIVSINGWLILEWKDQHLRWDPEKYDGISKITMADHEVWQPDIVVYESIPVSQIDPESNTHVVVLNDGTVSWAPPVTLYTICPLEVENYPQAIQYCKMTFGSWNHDGSAVNLRTSPNTSLKMLVNKNMRWKIVNANSTRVVTKYQCCNDPYVTVVYTFLLQRRSIFSQTVVRVPTLIAMTMTLLMFLLPPESGQKVLVGGMMLLLLTGLLLYTASSLGSTLLALIAVTSLHRSMAVVFSALVIEIIVVNLSQSAFSFGPPSLVNRILSGAAGHLLCVPPDIQPSESAREFYSLEEENVGCKRLPSYGSWRRVAVAIDRMAFLLFIIIIAVVLNT